MSINVGIPGPQVRSRCQDPVLLEDVLIDFPKLTVIGAHNSTRPAHDSRPGWWTRLEDQQTARKLLALDRLVIHPLITHRFPWQQAPQSYDLLKQWNKDALGIVLRWV